MMIGVKKSARALVFALFAILSLSAILMAGRSAMAQEADTLPSPPPEPAPITIFGPEWNCVGDFARYYIEAAIGCAVIWTVNGVVVEDEDGALEITWAAEGIQTIIAYLSCGPGQPLQLTREVIVNAVPSPIQIWGDTMVCEYTIHFYHTNAGPFDTCIWTVNGEVQPITAPAIYYQFGGEGTYIFTVEVRNNCGTGSPAPLQVSASGQAPPPPGPIEGPDTACTLIGIVYTTTTEEPGYPCLWYIDGVEQPDTSETITVTWTTPGYHLLEARTLSECGTSSPSLLPVLVYYLPAVDLGPDTAIYEGEFIILNAGNPGCTYLWSTGDTTQTIVVTEAGTYSVTVESYCGSAWDEIEVSIQVGYEEQPEYSPSRIYTLGGKIIIGQTDARFSEMQLFHITGQEVYRGPVIPVYSLPGPGIYIIRLSGEGYAYSRKVIAQ